MTQRINSFRKVRDNGSPECQPLALPAALSWGSYKQLETGSWNSGSNSEMESAALGSTLYPGGLGSPPWGRGGLC